MTILPKYLQKVTLGDILFTRPFPNSKHIIFITRVNKKEIIIYLN